MKTVLLMAVLLFSPLSFAQSLYQQLGEQQGIETIVEEMLYRVTQKSLQRAQVDGLSDDHRRQSAVSDWLQGAVMQDSPVTGIAEQGCVTAIKILVTKGL